MIDTPKVPAKNSTGNVVLDEIKEDLRREQVNALIARYGKIAVAVSVVLVLGAAAVQWQQARASAAAEKAGVAFYNAMKQLEAGKTEDTKTAMETLAAQDAQGYSQLAQLRVAALDLKAGKTADAKTIYGSLAADNSADVLFRDYAALQLSQLELKENPKGTDETLNRLRELSDSARPWHHMAMELHASALLERGDKAAAATIFESLSDERSDAPDGVRQRAEIIASLLK